ncbi:hypothetical protein U6A24_21255 [Aquimarina gracilis]|uniref:Uncharacterized protein n=1 Tax=Aquimarina gracilis TaxID=874422 RepID=A0ABU6A1N2_9FLAO|nr:hypothetical protein [Aquimarina gracilis]MEB3348017.1 hypothetical protein [Aquimarina gracilis]
MKKKSFNPKKLTLEKFEISKLNLTHFTGGSYTIGVDSGVNPVCGSNPCYPLTVTRRNDRIFTLDEH